MTGMWRLAVGSALLALCAGPVRGAHSQVEAAPDCEVPVIFGWIAREREQPADDDWRTAGSADRLREDACGHVWGLWFNSWSVHERGEAKRIGHLQLPYEGPLAALTRAGVADFVAEPGMLWVLGRNGQFARLDQSGWQLLRAPQVCRDGRLGNAAGELWLSCDGAAGHLLARWSRADREWHVERRAPGARPLLVAATPTRLYALGVGSVARIDGARIGPQETIGLPVMPDSAAIDARRIALAGQQGLWLQDRASGAWHAHLTGLAITGVALDAHGTLWAAVRNDGVRALVDGEWLAWRYAQGLPDAEARDLLVDRSGRLWLGGTPSAVIDAGAAARRMRALAPPPPIVADVHADACVAARVRIGAAGVSGEIASARLNDLDLVFFSGKQVCPDPWRGEREDGLRFRRASDGAVLELARNGRRGYMDCGDPCVEPSRSRLISEWGMAVHRPTDTGWEREQLPVPLPLPAQSPSWLALFGAGDEVVVASQGGDLYRRQAGVWQAWPAGSVLGADNRATAIAQDTDGSIWLGSSPTWSRALARYSGTPLHRWRHGRWRDLGVGADGHAWAVWDILPLADGALLAGNGGVRRVHRDGSDVEGFVPLTSGWVTALAVDRTGVWWAVHGLGHPGLSVHVDGSWRRLSSREGLLVDHWQALGFDAQDYAWLLAEDGRVAVYARKELLARAVKQDDLQRPVAASEQAP